MSLQNRVTPWGEIVADPARGLFTGNRGIIHDPATKTLLKRRWATRTWIVCACDYKNQRRKVMAKQSWTELFFLDEATALAAGHRPCFLCRRDDANRFRAAWCEGNDVARAGAHDIDIVLHAERLDGKAKRRHALPGAITNLPDGAMIEAAGEAYVIARGKALQWRFDGYAMASSASDHVSLLTPPSTLRALIAGYKPVLHESVVTAAS